MNQTDNTRSAQEQFNDMIKDRIIAEEFTGKSLLEKYIDTVQFNTDLLKWGSRCILVMGIITILNLILFIAWAATQPSFEETGDYTTLIVAIVVSVVNGIVIPLLISAPKGKNW